MLLFVLNGNGNFSLKLKLFVYMVGMYTNGNLLTLKQIKCKIYW